MTYQSAARRLTLATAILVALALTLFLTAPFGKADTGTATTTYTDDTVEANTHYTCRIKAINEYGVSERSRWFHIDTPAAP